MSNRSLALQRTDYRKTYQRALKTVKALCVKMTIEPPQVRWACYHNANGSDIVTYVPEKKGLATIAHTCGDSAADARVRAELIVQAVNNHCQYQPLITELISALEECMRCEKLTGKAEQEADVVCRKAKRMLGV